MSISEGIKGVSVLADHVLDSSRKPSHMPQETPHTRIPPPGLWVSEQPPNLHLSPSLRLAPHVVSGSLRGSRDAAEATSSRQGTSRESRPGSTNKAETTDLSCNTTFRNTK